MRHDWDRQHHPVYPAGVNSIETRVRLLEQARVFDQREKDRLHDIIASLTSDMERRDEEAEALMRSIGLRVISALIAALGGLGLMLAKLMFPSVF
jgi:hypothetical protein